MKKITLAVLIILSSGILQAQSKIRFPVWTFHDDSTTIHGLSVGFNSSFKISNIKVNGINFELLGLGVLMPIAPHSPVNAESTTLKNKFLHDTIAMNVNGFNISPFGSICDCNINGLNINSMASVANITNGLSITFFANFVNVLNGAQLSVIGNDNAFMNGLQFSFIGNSSQTKSNGVQLSASNVAANHHGVQIGLYNETKHLKGIQIGLWNKNQKRRLPFINWAFKS